MIEMTTLPNGRAITLAFFALLSTASAFAKGAGPHSNSTEQQIIPQGTRTILIDFFVPGLPAPQPHQEYVCPNPANIYDCHWEWVIPPTVPPAPITAYIVDSVSTVFFETLTPRVESPIVNQEISREVDVHSFTAAGPWTIYLNVADSGGFLTVTPNPFSATGQILDGSPVETKTVRPNTPTTPIYAQVPLGLELQIGIQRNGRYLPALFQLTPATLTGVSDPTLYPTNAVLEYGRTVHEGQKTFLGVHIGTQTLTVTPDDTTISAFTFTVGVFDPGALGNHDVQYDDMFVKWGNRRGIPPHIIKGIVRQEGFNPLAYRYEPLSPSVGDRFMQAQLTASPYSSYRLGTSTGLPQGTLLIDSNAGQPSYTVTDDISPRKSFVVNRTPGGSDCGSPGAVCTAITPGDICPGACVSARKIFEANDGTQNWSDTRYAPGGPRVDWWDDAHLAMLEFTAQTPLASSYGLMQTMWQRANELNWTTDDGRQNPSLLFDTPNNIAVGGGSLGVGTLEFYWAYRNCNPPNLATDPDFPNSDAYKSQMIDALNYYNHGNANKNLTYGDDAWNFAQNFLPSHPLSRIFP
jgi:hypothetical protein